jgi:asparagine synthase (glutamine-hydrolysing)
VLHRYVPRELVERPKKGFAIPVSRWLRQELRDWAEELLDEKRMHQEGFWEVGPIRQSWADHLEGREDYSFQLWGVLMFQAWLDASNSSVTTKTS